MADDKEPNKLLKYAKAFAVVAGGIAVILTAGTGYLKGDSAQQDVDSLIKQLNERVENHEKVINKQTDELQKLYRRVVFFQAHQEGVRAGELLATVKSLEEEIEQLHNKRKSTKPRVEVLRGNKVEDRKLSPHAPRSPRPDSPVQQIPTLHPKPFKGSGK